MGKEQYRIKGTPKQRIASAKEVFGQARILYETHRISDGGPFISKDPRLSEALKLLDLPSDLPRAVTQAQVEEERARETAERARYSWRY